MSSTIVSLLDLYSQMLRIRMVEEAVANRYDEQEMRCPVHLSIGQEAVAVGVSGALRRTDTVFGNHRAHAHYLAKGGNLKRMIAEFYGKSTGCCGGRGGSMHLIDQAVGFLGSTPIVGGTVPLAVGAAWSSKLKHKDDVSAVFFGDGCFEEGVMHESLNFAALHRLPVIFICENNDFSVFTSLSERQPNRSIHGIAAAHGLTTFSGDGNDVEAVKRAAENAVELARSGAGPQFLEFSVFRWREHCGPNFDDHLMYRTPEDVVEGQKRCPIQLAYSKLAESKNFDDQNSRIVRAIKQEIDDAFRFAIESAIPAVCELGKFVFAEA